MSDRNHRITLRHQKSVGPRCDDVLAELLDNDRAVPQHPAAAHRLIETLDKLGQSAGRRGRLAAVRDMTGQRGD